MHKIIPPLIIAGLLLGCSNNKSTDQSASEATTIKQAEPATPNKVEGYEFGDATYTEIGKAMATAFEKGDIDTWLNNFSDDAKFYRSAGDSLAGKRAISGYWIDRRKNVIDKLKYTNQIWLPLQVSKPQGGEMTGPYLLSWYRVAAKYKNGKELNFLVHYIFHFNSDNKIDATWQFMDRAPINEALGR